MPDAADAVHLPLNSKKDVKPALTGLSDVSRQLVGDKQIGPAAKPKKADLRRFKARQGRF